MHILKHWLHLHVHKAAVSSTHSHEKICRNNNNKDDTFNMKENVEQFAISRNNMQRHQLPKSFNFVNRV